MSMPHTLDPFRGMFRYIRVDIFSPSVNRRTSIVYARLPRSHQLDVQRFVLGFLRSTSRSVLSQKWSNNTKTYPFHPIQVIIRTDMLFCLSTVFYDFLSREGYLTSVASKELPQLLALVVGHNRLHLKGKINKYAARPSPNSDPIQERNKKNVMPTCLIREATILSTV